MKNYSLLLALVFFIAFHAIGSEISLTNIALQQAVQASSQEEPASAAVDGNPESYWQSAGMIGEHWLEVTWQEVQHIDRIVLPRISGTDSLLAEAWVNESWQLLGHLPDDNPMIAFSAVKTSRIRLRAVPGNSLRIYELQVFAYDPQPVFVNQVGYDRNRPKRFTAPLAEDSTPFFVLREGSEESFFEGEIQGHIGDFTAFQPEDKGPYRVVVRGKTEGRSVPFWIADELIEQIAYPPAINFMVDVRCWFGDSRNYQPTDEDANCPNLGVAWRDSHQFSFEIPSLLNLYFANPDAFSTDRMPVQGMYLGLREELPEETPEIVRLIYWAVDIYLRGEVNHTLLKEQLAYFLYAYPHLDAYIPRSVYEEARDYLFLIWGNEKINRWQWHDIAHNGDLFQVYDFIGTGKGQFPPGHSIVPNLMMYEVARREGRNDADRYFQTAYDQTVWLLENLDWSDPATTKGQRQGEHVTLTAFTYFLDHYPEKVPPGLQAKIESWADEMIRRADNMWDYRTFSDERWIIPSIRPVNSEEYDSETGFNEVGNIGGFAAPALAATAYVEDSAKKGRLEEMALAYVDHIFGRNPTGRHFGFDAVTDFAGVEMGWYKEYQGGAGILQTARGVLDGSPKETTYPYDPYAGDPGHTEGWVTFNTAWNTGLAYLSSSSTQIQLMDENFEKSISKVRQGETIGILLKAPLNFDAEEIETATVFLTTGETKIPIELTESDTGSNLFEGSLVLPADFPKGDAEVSYGLAWHKKYSPLTIR